MYKRPANLREEVLEKRDKKNYPPTSNQNKSNMRDSNMRESNMRDSNIRESNMRESNNRSNTQNINSRKDNIGSETLGGSLTPSRNNKFQIHTKTSQNNKCNSKTTLVEDQKDAVMYNTTNNSRNYNQIRNSTLSREQGQNLNNTSKYNHRDSKLLQDIKSKEELMGLQVRNNEHDISRKTNSTDQNSIISEKIPIRVDSKSNNGKSRFNQNYTKKQTLNLGDLDKSNNQREINNVSKNESVITSNDKHIKKCLDNLQN